MLCILVFAFPAHFLPDLISRMLRRKRRKLNASPAAEEDGDEVEEIMDDTLASIHLLLGRYHRGCAALNLPSIVLWHQLYARRSSR